MLLTRAPVSTGPKPGFTFDLHVLSLPPAFALSQDQTLRLISPGRANASTRDAPFGRVNVSARSHSLAHDCAGRAMRPSVNHAAACASLPRSSQCQRAAGRTDSPTQQENARTANTGGGQPDHRLGGRLLRPAPTGVKRYFQRFGALSAAHPVATPASARACRQGLAADSRINSGCLETLTPKPPGDLPDVYIVWRTSAATLRRSWLRQCP